ncbi:hypothetical protein LXL04_013027 [Taraxacum kok-saghyz]
MAYVKVIEALVNSYCYENADGSSQSQPIENKIEGKQRFKMKPPKEKKSCYYSRACKPKLDIRLKGPFLPFVHLLSTFSSNRFQKITIEALN